MNSEEYRERGSVLWLPANDHCTECDAEGKMDKVHALFGLQTETAELTDFFKKSWFTPNRHTLVGAGYLKEEMGDVLYYLDRLAEMHGYTLAEIMDFNIEKLEARYPRD